MMLTLLACIYPVYRLPAYNMIENKPDHNSELRIEISEIDGKSPKDTYYLIKMMLPLELKAKLKEIEH